jgi:hypothetical protein
VDEESSTMDQKVSLPSFAEEAILGLGADEDDKAVIPKTEHVGLSEFGKV